MSRYTFKTFEEARNFTRSLGIVGYENWKEYCKSGKRPTDIPSHPERVYKKEWNGFVDWLGSEGKTNQYLPFAEAREIVHKMGLENVRNWRKYLKSGILEESYYVQKIQQHFDYIP